MICENYNKPDLMHEERRTLQSGCAVTNSIHLSANTLESTDRLDAFSAQTSVISAWSAKQFLICSRSFLFTPSKYVLTTSSRCSGVGIDEEVVLLLLVPGEDTENALHRTAVVNIIPMAKKYAELREKFDCPIV